MDTLHTQIPIFKVGRHTDMSGTALEITEADLEKTVAAYQPSRHEAPLVAGHPQHDAPAWGWVASLALVDGVLLATPSQVDPLFAEQVAAGRYKKISASFYIPTAPSNPYPGVYYLRHVGFLGAQPPAVKGLPDAAFQDGEQGVIVMEAHSCGKNRSFAHSNTFEKMKHTKEKKMPDMPEKQQSSPANDLPADLQQALQAKEAALILREAQFAEREQQLLAAETEMQRKQAMVAALQFVEALVRQGQILPRHREGLAAFMASLKEDEVVEFAEAAAQTGTDPVIVKTPALTFFKKFLGELPVRVDYSERLVDLKEQEMPFAFSVPDGYEVDAVGLEMHRKILSYAKNNNMDFVSAALAVNK